MGGAAFHASSRDIDSAKLAATAIEKCARWKNPQKLDPGNYTVVLEPTAAGDLVRLMRRRIFGARNTEEGRTFLSKRGGGTLLGEKLFPEFITLRQRSVRSAAALVAVDRRSAAHARHHVDR